MSDLQHDIQMLITIARLDAQLAAQRGELTRVPPEIAKLEKTIGQLEVTEKSAQLDLLRSGVRCQTRPVGLRGALPARLSILTAL